MRQPTEDVDTLHRRAAEILEAKGYKHVDPNLRIETYLSEQFLTVSAAKSRNVVMTAGETALHSAGLGYGLYMKQAEGKLGVSLIAIEATNYFSTTPEDCHVFGVHINGVLEKGDRYEFGVRDPHTPLREFVSTNGLFADDHWAVLADYHQAQDVRPQPEG